MVKHLDWHGLYGDGWKGEIVPSAFQHPAKYSRALIRHIYEYLIKEKMVKPGDVVLDPFGGVALGGLDAARLGLHFIGCELEEKFVTLGNQNIALWNSLYAGKMPRWGSARLVQGDSRHLRDVIAQASAAVSSPPYSQSLHLNESREVQFERMRAKGQLDSIAKQSGNAGSGNHGYGDSDGQLAAMPEGDYRAAISSPPYADGCAHTGGDDPHPEHIRGCEYRGVGIQGAVSSPPYEEARIGQESGQEHCGHNDAYGATPGQMGAMKNGGYDAAVSSPPYLPKDDRRVPWGTTVGKTLADEDERRGYNRDESFRGTYSLDPANLGNPTGADQQSFWLAARQVVAETYAVLAPGAVAVFVVKDFIRNKARVPFCDQWRQLCEACGFSTYAIARAWLVEDHGTQLAMDGNHKRKRTERKSFFRRLAERKGSPRIDFETVLIMRKPEAAA